jgi:Leucine-rich repeat (LRR) protein
MPLQQLTSFLDLEPHGEPEPETLDANTWGNLQSFSDLFGLDEPDPVQEEAPSPALPPPEPDNMDAAQGNAWDVGFANELGCEADVRRTDPSDVGFANEGGCEADVRSTDPLDNLQSISDLFGLDEPDPVQEAPRPSLQPPDLNSMVLYRMQPVRQTVGRPPIAPSFYTRTRPQSQSSPLWGAPSARCTPVDSLEYYKIVNSQNPNGVSHLNLSATLSGPPPDVSVFRRLKCIDVSHNNLTELPTGLHMCLCLQTLSCEQNKLRSLPALPGIQLRQLNAAYNDIEDVQPILDACGTDLEIVHLNDNKLRTIPESLSKQTRLKELWLDHNRLSDFPDRCWPSQALGLGMVSLDHNKLQRLPLQFWLKPDGKDVSHNQLAELPDIDWGGLTTLSYLNLSHNLLAVLPANFADIPALDTLDLRHNRLTTLPHDLPASLTSVTIAHNRLTCVSSAVLARQTFWDLSYNRLTPESLQTCCLSHITELRLKCNDLTHIPPAIGAMTSLTELDLDDNCLTELPPEMGRLANLRRLWLRNNQLTTLPSELSQCTELGALVLTANPIQQLPLSFMSMHSLIEIVHEDVHRFEAVLLVNRRNRYGTDTLQAFAQEHTGECPVLLDALAVPEQQDVMEWWRRLKNMRNFFSCGGEHTVNDILTTVVTDPEFRETFFAQIRCNLERCGDRAAMSFNELFTAWKLHTCQSMTDLGRLRLCEAAAKTNTLRRLVSELPEAQRSESVELYLYVETKLKPQLELLTFADACLYGIAKDVVNLAELAEGVLLGYHDTLFDMLENNAKLFATFPRELGDKDRERFEKRLSDIDDGLQAGHLNEGQYMLAMDVLQQDRREAIRQVRLDWMNDIRLANEQLVVELDKPPQLE